jgi:hypothetical protein
MPQAYRRRGGRRQAQGRSSGTGQPLTSFLRISASRLAAEDFAGSCSETWRSRSARPGKLCRHPWTRLPENRKRGAQGSSGMWGRQHTRRQLDTRVTSPSRVAVRPRSRVGRHGRLPRSIPSWCGRGRDRAPAPRSRRSRSWRSQG